jgi:hypothetical protein
MNAFTEASIVETHAMRDLIPWIENNEFIQCGVNFKKLWIGGYKMSRSYTGMITCEEDHKELKQLYLFEDKVEFEYVKSVIGSGYEEQVAKLAIEDKVAYRAARKNMQIHSAIILKINFVCCNQQ